METLGEVVLPSGTVVVVDTGLLDMWSHDQAPLLSEHVAPEISESANKGRDYRIDGADADKAGKLFDRQWHPRYVFDIPSHGIAPTEQAFVDLMREQHLDARLVPLVPRVSHLQRARLALEQGNGAGELQIHGVPLIAVGGLRTPLKVLGERSDGEFGFVDLPVEEAAERGMKIKGGGYKMSSDFRPHSHHYQVMKQVRASPTESGTLELAGSKLCAFMTSWGNGVFVVARDLDANGQLVGVTIDFEGEP